MDPFSLAVGATVISTLSGLFSGIEEKKAAYAEASQLRRRAKARRAEASLGVEDEARRARLKMSRAQAVAASSGAGVSDPTIVNLMGDLAAEGEYKQLVRLYEGQEEALGLEEGARIRKREGRAALFRGVASGVSSAFTGMSDLATKYGT